MSSQLSANGMVSRRGFLASAGAAPLLAKGRRRPNVIVILTDDQGYGDLACHGNTVIRTPNLDRLHGESVRFTNFHVDPLCSPTRSALMSGRYSARVGAWATVMSRNFLRRDETTMAQEFSANGYRTGIFGKWHLGDNYPYHPENRGFDEALTHRGGGVGNTPDAWGNSYFNDTYFRNGKPEKFTGYCTDVWFDNALKFVEANRRNPFFLYVPTNAPHSPYRVPAEFSRPYRERGLNEQLANFYGMITNIDQNVGRLRGRLKELGLDQDTLLVWMTDNGTAAGTPGAAGGSYGGFDAGMRATKGAPYDGGHRVPCFVSWPGGGIGGGRDAGVLASHFDLLPTFLDLAGLRRKGAKPLDGTSLGPVLRGKGELPERTLVVQTQQRDTPQKWTHSAVLTDGWRLVNGRELYDIRQDPGQKNDLAAARPETVEQLRASYEKWWANVSVRFGEYSPIVVGAPQENPTLITAHDWHTDSIAKVVWNQDFVRARVPGNGFWEIEAARAGEYEFTLREQPAEAKFAIPASSARLKVGGVERTAAMEAGATSVAFRVPLEAGRARLETWLEGTDGKTRGAYYVDVRRL